MLRVIATAVIVVLLAAVALVAGAATMIAAAAILPEPALFLAGGALVLALGGVLVGLVVAARHRGPRRACVVVAAAALVVIGGYLALVPLGDPQRPARPVEGMQHVDLATGDRLAYVRLQPPGGADAVEAPIVFVHGGPGVADMHGDAEALRELTSDGRELILYDQVGTGHADRLADPRGYTLERDVDDLEALLAELGLERPVLIGHSYGATVIAAYLARNPDGAEKIVLSAPGAIRPYAVSHGTGMVDRLDTDQKIALYGAMLQPRALIGWLLSQVDPRAAVRYASDAELDARFDRTYALTAPGLFCEPPSSIPLPTGLGFFANGVQRTIPDLRPALADVDAPVLIVKPQCDYLPWSYGVDARDAFARAELVYLEGAGHSTYIEQRGSFLAEVRAFLADEPLPIPPWTSSDPPADLDGPID